MKVKHANLTAYDNFENLRNFDNNLLAKYRKSSFVSASVYMGFIKRLFPGKRIKVFEIGSGNSSTLFALEAAGILEKGFGVEISRSRFKFAQCWKREYGYNRVKNINANINDLDFNIFNKFDLCICLDFVFHTFEPIKKTDPISILKKIFRSLHPKGKIILELDGYKRILSRMENGNIKFWQEFSPLDPWRYVLHDCKYNVKTKMLTWNKRYIKREEFGFSESTVILRMYKKNGINYLLKKAGFKKIKLFSDWEGNNFKNDELRYIVVGEK